MTLTTLEKPDAGFFWTAPFADDSEFLPLDPLALDYLGQQVGLWLFPALTTRTSRAQYYCVVLYGLWLADKIAPQADDDLRVALFERWERFWAMATLASHDGPLPRGHENAMRGLRGATRAWKAGDSPIPLDYPLISRQEELGGLGAYLSSSRQYQFIRPGAYKPEPSEILECFWAEPESKARTSSYENYCLQALDLDRKTIDRKVNNITLAGVGHRTRLSSLVERERKPQQDRLFARLFTNGKGPTPILESVIQNAWKKDVREPRLVIENTLAGKFGELDSTSRDLLDFTRRFGTLSQEALQAFNELYAAIVNAGWVTSAASAIGRAFDTDRVERLQRASAELLDGPLIERFRSLPVHAASFGRLALALRTATAPEAAEAILVHHRQVQRERGLGGGWIRRDGDKLVVDVSNWSGQRLEAVFPSFRINTVQSLLRDLGRIS